ncbi:MAG: peptide deformylase [Sedimentisphaerales bacterium]|nr:peptide deformylase [Sedimentisphaerales bacterium]
MYEKIDVAKLHLEHYPAPILRKVAEPVVEIDDTIAALVDLMWDVMFEADGVGLAAPQVGVSLRIFIVSVTGRREDGQVFINPELSNLQGVSETEEGCLSVPGVRSKVRRAGACTVKALDLDGNTFVLEAADLSATAVQHENDHLDGKLFIDRLTTVGRIACRRGLKQLEREYSG